MILLSILGLLIPLAVIGGTIALIVRAVGKRRPDPGATGDSVRRFFQYSLLLGVFVLVAIGLTGLLDEIIPDRGITLRRDSAKLAQAISFLLVGGPVLYGLARWTKRQLDQPGERESFGWAFFLSSASIISLVTAGTAAFQVLSSALGSGGGYRTDPLAGAVVWGAAWYGLWRLVDRHGDHPRMQLERMAGSAIGLSGLAIALWFLVSSALQSIYDATFSLRIVDDLAANISYGVAGLVVGALIWWWYWLRHAAKAEPTPVWRGYVMLIGVLGGLITAVAAGSTALFAVLQWFFGDPEASSAVRQFDLLPWAVTAAAVGVGMWAYHRATLTAALGTNRTETSRVYDYLAAGVGLFAAAGGMTTVLVALLESLSPVGIVDAGRGSANVLVAAITLLIVGVPLWWIFWSRIQRHAAAEPGVELTSGTRRISLSVLFGVGGIVALISLVFVVFIGIEDLIEGIGGETLRRVRVPLALVLTMGIIAWYHWRIFRNDRATRPDQDDRIRLREVVMMGGNDELERAITEALDVRIRRWQRLDNQTTGPVEAATVIENLEATGSRQALLIIEEETCEVVPFEEG